MDGIGGALGGINDFEVTFDDVDNTFRIIDNTYVANSGKDNITELQINTLTANSGTFVKDVNLKTELTARIANAIAAGAQKNGNTMVSNGTTFAKFNEGYVDRIIEKKQNKNNTGTTNDVYGDRLNILYNYITKLFALVWDPNESAQSPTVTTEDAQSANGVAKDIYQYELGHLTEGVKDPKTGNDVASLKGTMFIPLNLQVTVDGLSGVKQYQLFKTNQQLLPAEYHDRLAFIVKGLSHKIDDNGGWSTTIETLAVKRFNKGTTEDSGLGTILNIEVPETKNPPKKDESTDGGGFIGGDDRYLPLKKMIFDGEAGSYDAINGSAKKTGIDNSRVTVVFGKFIGEYTIREIVNLAIKRGNDTEWSDAIGRYQNKAEYVIDRAIKVGLDPDVDKYNEANQEKMGEGLIDDAVGGYIRGSNTGTQIDLENAVQKIGQIWTSKPIIYKKEIWNDKNNNGALDDGEIETSTGRGTYGDVTTGLGNVCYYLDGQNPKITKVDVKTVVIALIDTRKNFTNSLPSYVPDYYN